MDMETFLSLADRYRQLTDDMRRAFPLIAAGRRDSAADILGDYGYRWDIVESLLADMAEAGIDIPACR